MNNLCHIKSNALIINHLEHLYSNTSHPEGLKYLEWQINVAQNVQIQSYKTNSVLENMINLFLESKEIKQRECFKNAHLLINFFPDELKYVEGYKIVSNLIIEHAWTYHKETGIHFDLTRELWPNDNEDYVQIIRSDSEEVLDFILKEGYHNPYIAEYYRKSIIEAK
ncbi:MAG: hypothetical protein GY756_27170 [bacterium]|nr:hypothetical protein [bacterium]